MIRTTTTATRLPFYVAATSWLTRRLTAILLRCATDYPVRLSHHRRQSTSTISFTKQKTEFLTLRRLHANVCPEEVGVSNDVRKPFKTLFCQVVMVTVQILCEKS